MRYAGLFIAAWQIAWLTARPIAAEYRSGHLKIESDGFTGHAWYPTDATEGVSRERYLPLPFTRKVEVIPGAALSAGRAFPVAVISHGILGMETSYSWLATELASKGFIVLAPHHDGQSRTDLKEIELLRFWKRPAAVSQAIDWAFASEAFKAGIAADSVFFIGHSVGGHTGLMLAGLPFDIGRVLETAESSPARNNLAKRMKKAAAAENPAPEDLSANQGDYRDERILRFVLLDPTPILPGFSEAGFAKADRPILYVGSSRSEIFNSDWVKTELARLNPGIDTVETHAGHFIFADEGTWLGRTLMGRIFKDPEGIDRAKVHADLAKRIEDFFRRDDRTGLAGNRTMP